MYPAIQQLFKQRAGINLKLISSPKIPTCVINISPSCLTLTLKNRGYSTIVHRVAIATMTDLLKDMALPVLALSHKCSKNKRKSD